MGSAAVRGHNRAGDRRPPVRSRHPLGRRHPQDLGALERYDTFRLRVPARPDQRHDRLLRTRARAHAGRDRPRPRHPAVERVRQRWRATRIAAQRWTAVTARMADAGLGHQLRRGMERATATRARRGHDVGVVPAAGPLAVHGLVCSNRVLLEWLHGRVERLAAVGHRGVDPRAVPRGRPCSGAKTPAATSGCSASSWRPSSSRAIPHCSSPPRTCSFRSSRSACGSAPDRAASHATACRRGSPRCGAAPSRWSAVWRSAHASPPSNSCHSSTGSRF